jgi:UPF0755 protein
MKRKFIILFSTVLIISFFIYLWWKQAVKPYNPHDNNSIQFTIERGENSRLIADKLAKKSLIRSPVAFFILARFGGLADKIQAGTFQLSPSMDLYTIGELLKTGKQDVLITIIEGIRKEEVASILSKELNMSEAEFINRSKEGYIFPDTYSFPKTASVTEVLDIINNNFSKKVNQDIINKAKNINLSLDQLITIASLVEREAKLDQDRPLIASVILNRLKDGMKLDIDATVQYALGYQIKDKTWWKKDLTINDLQINSTYNTYINPGLPPTPICNPGIAVINAILKAPNTEYYYYLADKTGKSYFAKDYSEHQTNIKKYLE